MSSAGVSNGGAYSTGDDITKGKPSAATFQTPSLPTSDSLRAAAGGLLKGATDDNGKLKSPALLVGIKLDLEAEVHLTARVKGDITIGLY